MNIRKSNKDPEIRVYRLKDELVRYYDNYLSCGLPGLIGDEREEMVPASEILDGGKEEVYIAEILGDSMIGAGLCRGDHAVIRTDVVPKSGDIVLADIAGEDVLKYLMIDEDGDTWLVPANDAYKPMKVDFNKEGNRIRGVMSRVVKVMPRPDSVVVKRFNSFIKEEYRKVRTTDEVACPFHKYIPNDKDKKRVMERLHNLLDGQEGVTIVKILKAAEHVGYLVKLPSEGDLNKEFSVTISHSVYYKSKNINYNQEELETYIDNLL